MYETLEIVNEMYERGISFLPIDLYESSATRFRMEDEGIRPPLNSIPGFGTVAAQGVEEARKDGEFMSIDDLKIRAKIGKTTIEMLEKVGCLKGMSQSNQMSLFAQRKDMNKNELTKYIYIKEHNNILNNYEYNCIFSNAYR